jgi:hypothetical protein
VFITLSGQRNEIWLLRQVCTNRTHTTVRVSRWLRCDIFPNERGWQRFAVPPQVREYQFKPLPVASPPRGHYPTGPLGLTHGRPRQEEHHAGREHEQHCGLLFGHALRTPPPQSFGPKPGFSVQIGQNSPNWPGVASTFAGRFLSEKRLLLTEEAAQPLASHVIL